ncbi:MAG: alpha-L-fucosidase [Phycisphaerales bacterium]|nr:alpha-L-fucosidase [Phycisphaerales bacterium]
MNMRVRLSASAAVLIALASGARGAEGQPADEAAELARWSADRAERMAWWHEARFGMFIHWGLYSGAGGEWNGTVYPQHYAEWIQHWAAVPCDEYARRMRPLFRPDPGAAEEWADLAKAAGMRYAVMTGKHHEGFTLFNSDAPYSRFNFVTGGTNISPPGRDLAREFADAMRSRGLRAGFYYSLLDWQHPQAYEMALPAYPREARARDHIAYIAYVRGHIEELLTNYGPLCTIWFDFSDREHQGAAWGAADLLALMRRKQPGILVNNRLFEGLENPNGDYGTPEKYVPPTGLKGMSWEVNHTLNESYGFSAHDAAWKDTTTVVRLLCDVVSKGGNLLLNIGPDARGHVPPEAQATLRGVGAWMAVNGEAIYGSGASPFPRLTWGRATRKPGIVYLMVFDWPVDGVLDVPMRAEVRSARVLGREGALAFEAAESGGVAVRVPGGPVDPACTVVRLDVEGEVQAVVHVAYPDANGVATIGAQDALVEGPSLRVEQVGAGADAEFNLGYWLDADATATFLLGLRPAQAGVYGVEVEVACTDDSDGARVVLATPGGDLTFEVPPTGGWQTYRVLEIGDVTLDAGEHRLVLRALTKPGEAVANVRRVTLRKK